MNGATVCPTHGGRAPQVKAAAANRVAERRARATFGRLSDHSTPVTDPLTALGGLAGHVTAWMEFLGGQVADLTALRFTDAKGSEQIDGRVQLFRQALVDCNTVLATVAKLNIDERLAAITAAQHAMVLRAVEAALDAAGVAPERRGPAKKAAAGHLRLTETG